MLNSLEHEKFESEVSIALFIGNKDVSYIRK